MKHVSVIHYILSYLSELKQSQLFISYGKEMKNILLIGNNIVKDILFCYAQILIFFHSAWHDLVVDCL